MKRAMVLATLLFTLFVASCVQSLHPLYSDDTLFFEPSLVGTWAGDGGDMWIFLQKGKKSYELVYTEKGTPAKFDANLVKLGPYLFLDLFPTSVDFTNDLQQAHLLSTHTFLRLWLDEDTLRLTMLEHDWLRRMIDEKRVAIKHERLKERIVLTASTPDLQKFMQTYGDNTEAFPKPKTGLARQKK
jgi:hypothetical protein